MYKFQFHNIALPNLTGPRSNHLAAAWSLFYLSCLTQRGLVPVFARSPDRTLWHKGQVICRIPHLPLWFYASVHAFSLCQRTSKIFITAVYFFYWNWVLIRLFFSLQIGKHQPRSVRWSDWKSLGGILSSEPQCPKPFQLCWSVGGIQITH